MNMLGRDWPLVPVLRTSLPLRKRVKSPIAPTEKVPEVVIFAPSRRVNLTGAAKPSPIESQLHSVPWPRRRTSTAEPASTPSRVRPESSRAPSARVTLAVPYTPMSATPVQLRVPPRISRMLWPWENWARLISGALTTAPWPIERVASADRPSLSG